MNNIFEDFGITITEENGKYYLTYDSGELVIQIEKIEISKEDAERAMIGESDAYSVILKYQGLKNEFHGNKVIEKIKDMNVIEVNSEKWITKYKDSYGNIWIKDYPHGELQGGGPPRLRLSENMRKK